MLTGRSICAAQSIRNRKVTTLIKPGNADTAALSWPTDRSISTRVRSAKIRVTTNRPTHARTTLLLRKIVAMT